MTNHNNKNNNVKLNKWRLGDQILYIELKVREREEILRINRERGGKALW